MKAFVGTLASKTPVSSFSTTDMSLSQQEQAYLAKHPMQRLTFDGVADLYQSLVHGAVTIHRAMELDRLHAAYRSAHSQSKARNQVHVSNELLCRHLECVEIHGCGLFEGY